MLQNVFSSNITSNNTLYAFIYVAVKDAVSLESVNSISLPERVLNPIKKTGILFLLADKNVI